MFDAKKLKKDFPIFSRHPDLIYLDSAATALKPRSVIHKLQEYYEQYSANVHRGIYKIAEKATEEYEKSRDAVAELIHASRREEIVFTRSTTESINLIAYSLGRQIINSGDEIVTTVMEHHSNFVPWQQLAFENGATFKVIDIDEEGYPAFTFGKIKNTTQNQKLPTLEQVITGKTKILTITYISNVLGTINPMKEIIAEAKRINHEVICIVDAAQAVPHLKIDVEALGCDFLVFSGHKMLGPTGVGVLWGRYDLLDQMFPFQYGGEMIMEVAIEKTSFKTPPYKFEAGTPHIAGVVALQEAMRYLQLAGYAAIQEHERELTGYALQCFHQAFGETLSVLGPKNVNDRAGLISFTFGRIHPHDIAQILDEDNIAVRAGHHCTMPLHKRLDLPSSTRASFYIYNHKSDIDRLVEGLKKVQKVLSR